MTNSKKIFNQLITLLRPVFTSSILILLSISVGTVGYMFLEHYTLVDAFFMTIITLATVGYGLVEPLSELGKWFTSSLIIINTGIFAYAISNITVFLVNGQLQHLFKLLDMNKQIEALEQHTIICGFGRHGREIFKEFKDSKQKFIIIEQDAELLKQLKETNAIYLEGDATKDESLLDAGIERAQALIVTVSNETDNLYIVLSAKELNPNLKIITRSSSENVEKKLYKAGATHVIMPEKISGYYMANLIKNPHTVEFFNILSNMGKVNVHFEEIECKRLKKEFLNKSLKELQIRQSTGANVIGLHYPTGKYEINPSGEVIITNDMKLVVIGDEVQIEQFEKHMLHH
jgi:voltage-gated potassium channel